MKKQKKWFLIFLLMVSTQVLNSVELPMNQLKWVADGLNIEGGRIPSQYLEKGQIWANLCVVLDRPFEDGIEWQQLTNLNPFPLKEASLLDYNEAQVNLAYVSLMGYYMEHAHQIVHKPDNQTVKILIQVHRNTSGPRHIELLEQFLLECYPEWRGIKQYLHSSSKYALFTYLFPNKNVEVNFCYGSTPDKFEELAKEGKYREVDIVLSFSLVAGLHSNWTSGSLLIPEKHIPFSLKDVTVSPQTEYSIQNHLIEAIPDIMRCQDQNVLKVINEKFRSLNPQKQHLMARLLTSEDFNKATLLQVDGDFNPSQLPLTFNWNVTSFNQFNQ